MASVRTSEFGMVQGTVASRDLDNIIARLLSAKDRIGKITLRVEEDADRIAGSAVASIKGAGAPRDAPDFVVGKINTELDNIESWLRRLDDATGRFSNL